MDQSNALSLRGGGLVGKVTWPKASDWLIRDELTDTVAAGSVNGTAATPGPGTRAVTDTESKLSVSSGVLAIAGGKASPSTGDPGIWYDSQTRAAGLALLTKITWIVDGNYSELGWDSNEVGPTVAGVLTVGANLRTRPEYSAVIGSFAEATPYTWGVILRTTGDIVFVKGGSFASWTLLWVGVDGNTATLYPAIANTDAQIDADYLRCIQLPAPFNTDDGLATDTHSGSVAAGTTFSHEENALIEATITTVPSADNIDIVFRQQDASNYWICRIATGGDISLQEVVAGSPTQRGVAAGVVSNGHRVVIIAEGTTIKGYSNNTLRWTYSSASNFATATAGEVDALGTGGAVSNLKTWPRTLSGTAASILNKVSA